MSAQGGVDAQLAKAGISDGTSVTNQVVDTLQPMVDDLVNDVTFVQADYTIPTENVHVVDFYLDDVQQADAIATLQPIDDYPDKWACLIINDSTQGYEVSLVEDTGGGSENTIKRIFQGTAFTVYKREDGLGGYEFATAQLRGNVPALLPAVPYANLNHPEWQRFDAGVYEVTAPYQDFANIPTYTNPWQPATPVTMIIEIVVTNSGYKQKITPLAPLESANDNNGREGIRIGVDWASAVVDAWRNIKFTSDP